LGDAGAPVIRTLSVARSLGTTAMSFGTKA
jgi:hypothetical protein